MTNSSNRTKFSRLKKDAELSSLEVLALDCQADGMNPLKDRLFELGWLRFNPHKQESHYKLSSYLIKSPADNALSRRVSIITGLSDEDFVSASPGQVVWNHLLQTAREVNKFNKLEICPVVIHFARFENAHLRHLHATFSGADSFPFKIICTFEIARRLFPDLPRKGIRAVAGYLGYSVEEKRRVVHHAKATAFIWKKLLPLLDAKKDIKTVNQLCEWLSTDENGTSGRMIYPMAENELKGLPQSPGVYKMLRSNRDVLYVGKATSLKDRVNSYFRKQRGHPEHVLEMLSQAQRVDYKVSKTALEAALLENEEIKRLSPPYNIALKKAERQICFFSSDLSSSNTAPGNKFRVGPIPEPHTIHAFHSFQSLLNDKDGDSHREAYLNCLRVPEEYAPDYDCFMEGVNLFRKKYLTNPESRCTKGLLLSFGRLIWKENQKTKQSSSELQGGDALTTETESKLTKDEVEWTPESVLRHFESVLKHTAHQIRRARFLLLLSECSLAWELKLGSPRKRLLIIKCAQVYANKELLGNRKSPMPPGYPKKSAARLKSFDLDSYDRMRVLSTEIRRLVSEGRPAELRLGRGRALTAFELKKVFEWL